MDKNSGNSDLVSKSSLYYIDTYDESLYRPPDKRA